VFDELKDQGKALPPFDKHMDETWRELEELASEPDEVDSSDANVA
jgi:hypothetical protein